MCGASASRAHGRAGSSIAMMFLLVGWPGIPSIRPVALLQYAFSGALAPATSKKDHGYIGTHQANRNFTTDRAVHEGHAAVPDVRVFQPHVTGAQSRRRRVRFSQRARRSRGASESAALF